MASLRQIVCAGLCRYYKPDKVEPVGCGGLEWLKARPELEVDLARLRPAEEEPLFGLSHDDPRLWAICNQCEFRVDGCDFRDPAVAADQCAPCGGLRAVAGLLAAGRELGL
ncbi:MAG: hypothetical protein AB1814_14080 [Thermodesulfobacteriota bacterium]